MNTLFSSLFDTTTTTTTSLPVAQFFICIAASLVIGLILSFVYCYKSRYSKSFVVTLALLPAIVCAVIMMVNGNVGAGVAVAGTFSLVRFRSVPGTAKDIGTIFMAMAAGLIAGMGYIGLAFLFTLIIGAAMIAYTSLGLGENNNQSVKNLRITIPENLDYTGLFDDEFTQYTSSHKLLSVKTTNMGSMFKLVYDVTLKDVAQEKKFIDDLRVKNGNLEITVSQQELLPTEL